MSSLSEIRHEAEIYRIKQRSLEQWPDAAEKKCVQLLSVRVGSKHPIVTLDVAMDVQLR